MQSVSNAEATSTTYPALLLSLRGRQEQNGTMEISAGDLQLKAQAGLQAAGQAIGDQAAIAKDALNERIVIARAGTKLWQDGAATALLARKAAIDAATLDSELLSRAQVASAAFRESAVEMRAAQTQLEITGPADLAVSFASLAAEQEERAKAYGEALDKLRESAVVPELSGPEWDALRLAQLGLGCQEATKVAAENTRVASEHISRSVTATASKLLTSVSERGIDADVSASSEPVDESLHGRMLRLQTYVEQAMNEQAIKLQSALNEQGIVVQAAFHERMDTIRAGTKLWNDGAATVVLAKKAAIDTAKLDAELLLGVQTASTAFQQSATSLRAAQSESELVGAMDSAASLADLAEEHEERAKVYGEVLHLLRQPAVAPELNAPEWDALRLAQLGRGCQEATQAAAEKAKVVADHVSRCVDVAGLRAMKECC
jgi:hypothetical protein